MARIRSLGVFWLCGGLRSRYRVVPIGVNSVVMENTGSKREQTFLLAEDAG